MANKYLDRVHASLNFFSLWIVDYVHEQNDGLAAIAALWMPMSMCHI
jgi:hypothetical protein